MPPVNRLAPPSQNSLAYSVPVPLEPGMLLPPPPRRFVPMRELENFSIGMGRGIRNGLEGTKQMLTQPVATAQALIAAAQQIGADPRIILDMLRAARQKAMSGSLGLGELIGENVMPTMRGRGGPVSRMAGPEDFMARRKRQLIAEENAESKSIMRDMDERRYRQDLEELMKNKDWLSETERRADVISKLDNLALYGIGLGPRPSLSRFEAISKHIKQADNPTQAYYAKESIAAYKPEIDKDFDDYIAMVRQYRKTLNPRSKYDRQEIKLIDDILGDVRVIELKRD